ncbi:MAG: hypothetical protein FWG50_08735 [Kiritimatiellaeota bacterium]|nr:hypothetical protein [Kiritimatiellota bacterium]
MKRLSVGFECAVLGVALSVLTAVTGSAWAQTGRLTPTGPKPVAGGAAAGGAAGAGGAGDRVEIKRFPEPSKTALVRTPEFNVNASGGQSKVNTRPRLWALFEVRYATGAKWMDELAFTYHVMTKGKDDEGKEDVLSYYTQTVRYIDIPKGEHMSCVALPPSLVERYGEPVALALEIVGKDGTVLASESKAMIPFPSPEWWKDSQVLDNAKVKRRQGLVDRSKTPFALVNADDYEVVQ